MIKIILKQMRVHQWSKNLLLFFPALLNNKLFYFDTLTTLIISFFSFSFIASSIYVLNDIIDVNSDRLHPIKKHRPIANGEFSIISGYVLIVILLSFGYLLSFYVGYNMVKIISIYIFSNLLYSSYLKNFIVIDILMLVWFYTLRLICGNLFFDLPISEWLISFSIFLFFSLGLLKRYIDNIVLENKEIKLRVYNKDDSSIIMNLGVGSGLISTLVIILYLGSDQIKVLYTAPIILILNAPLVLFWISRLWILGARGKIKNDPVKFTLTDPITYLLFILGFMILNLARHVTI